jgi:hypothetical protein
MVFILWGSAYEAKWYVTIHVKNHVSCDIQESSNNSKKGLAPSSTHHCLLPITEALFLALVFVFKKRKQTGVNIYTDSHMMDFDTTTDLIQISNFHSYRHQKLEVASPGKQQATPRGRGSETPPAQHQAQL